MEFFAFPRLTNRNHACVLLGWFHRASLYPFTHVRLRSSTSGSYPGRGCPAIVYKNDNLAGSFTPDATAQTKYCRRAPVYDGIGEKNVVVDADASVLKLIGDRCSATLCFPAHRLLCTIHSLQFPSIASRFFPFDRDENLLYSLQITPFLKIHYLYMFLLLE